MAVDARDMALRGRIGGHVLRATHDPQIYTAKARSVFLARFIPDDPDLSEDERMARAQAGLTAHMLQLARKSALARKRARPRRHSTP